MARTVKGFRVDTKRKVVVLYTNMKRTVEQYFEDWKNALVEMMKKELKGKDKAAFDEFVKLYETNDDEGLGFHKACKYYSDWKKSQNK